MGVDVAVSRARARASLTLAERLAAIPVQFVLGGLVAVSSAIRTVAAFGHATQVYFPDEYIYSALARSFAETGKPLIRGHAAHFPSLLEPILAAPFWLPGDPMLAYRLTQVENAFFMSLGAIPVYLLARRLGCGKWLALALGGLALASPDLFFGSFVLAGPVAYPLVLSAVYAAVCVLDRPTRKAQVAFVAFSGLAAFARIQYVVLPVALLAAALVLERGSIRRVVGRLRLSLGIFLGFGAVFAAAGPARALGYYSGISKEHIHPLGLLHWVGADGMLLAYSAGIVLVPGALIALVLALTRPRERVERAFAAFTIAFGAAVFGEAALYASNGSGRYQERYLMTLVPLLGVAFALYARRRSPGRKVLAGLACGFLLLSASVPLSGYTIGDGKQDSPFLFAVFRLEQVLSAGGGSLLVAAIAAVLCALALGLAFLGRRGIAVGIAATVAVFGAVSFAANTAENANARAIRQEFLPSDRQWVDHARLGRVAMLETPGAPFGRALEQLVWNRSVDSVLLFGPAAPIDDFATTGVRAAADGRLLAGGRPVRRALLVENYAVRMMFRDARPVASGGTFTLWKPSGIPHLDLVAYGLFSDGWLAGQGQMFVWPDAAGRVDGTLRLVLTSPRAASRLVLRFQAPGLHRAVALRPGERRVVTLPVHARGVWELGYSSSMHGSLEDGRQVSVRLASPVFVRR